VWFGASAGGGVNYNDLRMIEKTGGTPAWKVNTYSVSGIASNIWYARNSAVVIGDNLYVGGPRTSGGSNAFYKINLTSKTVAATLTAWPIQSNEYFPQMVHDTRRNKLVLFGIKVFEYDLSTESPSQTWVNVTPSGWPGYQSPMGVYHPANDAIYFRGAKVGGTMSDGFQWHMMKFDSGGTVIRVPSTPGFIQVR
jgi:hypothetical protein